MNPDETSGNGLTDCSEQTPEQKVSQRPWGEGPAVELWKYFANVGGSDKNRMVTVTTWLLGFSGVILWYLVTERLDGWQVEHSTTTRIPAVVGVVDSVLACIVVMTFAGYANRNWAMADAIADLYGWDDLHPQKQGSTDKTMDCALAKAKPPWIIRGVVKRSWEAAKPHNPQEQWAPIFYWFLLLSVLSFLAHAVFFCFSFIGASQRAVLF